MVRSTAQGKLEGFDDTGASGTYWWKGIPFAQPPVGALRWRAPVEPAPWTGIRQAREFGHPSLQIGRVYGPGVNNTYDATIASTLNTAVGSEDCLTLNIWRPASTEDKLPVMLFIHGGSNVSGYSADPLYDGANLARKENAVIVTANYRLGVFGFLNIPRLRVGGSQGVPEDGFARGCGTGCGFGGPENDRFFGDARGYAVQQPHPAATRESCVSVQRSASLESGQQLDDHADEDRRVLQPRSAGHDRGDF